MTDEVKVHYTRTVRAYAKVHGINQAGIHFMKLYNRSDPNAVIEISCINKKDGKLTTGLALQIPREDLDNVIDALKQMR